MLVGNLLSIFLYLYVHMYVQVLSEGKLFLQKMIGSLYWFVNVLVYDFQSCRILYGRFAEEDSKIYFIFCIVIFLHLKFPSISCDWMHGLWCMLCGF